MSIQLQNIDEEIRKKIFDGVKHISHAEKEIKGIRRDIKDLKSNLKAEGAEVKVVNKAITLIKRDIKDELDPLYAEARQLADELKEDEEIYNNFFQMLNGDL